MPRRLTLIALCAALVSLAAASPAPAAKDQADRQFTFAVRLLQQGERELATEALGEFLRRFPDDRRAADAHYYLAVLARRRGDTAAARKQLERVDDPLHVADAAVSLLRGQVRLESGRAKEAIAALDRVDPKKLPDEAARATLAHLLGVAYQRNGNPQAAAEHFRLAARRGGSQRGPSLLELGKARIEIGEPEAAAEALRQALEADLSSARTAEARALLADLAYQQQNYEAAAGLYRKVVENHQSSDRFKPAVAGLLRSLYAAGKNEKLIQRYQSLREQVPSEAIGEVLYLVGAAHVRLRRYNEAADLMLDFYRRFGPDHHLSQRVSYLYAICFYHTDLRGFEKWMETVEDQLETMPHGAELRYLRARGAVKRDKPAEAIEHLRPLIESPDDPYAKRALLQRATLHDEQGHPREAAADYALYLKRYPDGDKAVRAGKRAVRLTFQNGNYERAAELAGTLLKRDGLPATEAASVRLKRAVSLIQLDREKAALDELNTLVTERELTGRVATFAHYYRGLLLASRSEAPRTGDPADTEGAAVDSLNKALDGDALTGEQWAQAMTVIARLHRQAGREKEALAAYEKLRQRQAAGRFDAPTVVWIARGLHESGRHEAALAWLNPLLERGPQRLRNSTFAEALFLAGRAQQRREQWGKAIERFRRLVAFSHGYGDQGRLHLAQCLAADGRAEQALNEYDGLISVESSDVAAAALLEGALLRLDRARRLERAGDTRKAKQLRRAARKHLNRLVLLHDVPQLRPTVMRALVMLGRLDAQAGNTDRARKRLGTATDHDGPAAWRRAAKAELALLDGRRGEAVFLLRKIVDEADDQPSAAVEWARRRLNELGATP